MSNVGNSYLAIAYQAICDEARPLTPQEMLDTAERRGYMPSHLRGKTMNKTMSARLAEYIRLKSGQAIFYRTSPNTFFLHSLAKDPKMPDEFKGVFIGNLRAKTIRKEEVLVASKRELEHRLYGDFVPFEEEGFLNLYRDHCRFLDREMAEGDKSVKQFVTFTLVVHDSKILTHRRGKFSTASETLKGQISVGFGGHVNADDFTLFSVGADGLRANAARELREELFLDDFYEHFEEAKQRTRILGYINVDDSDDAQHHIAVLVLFHHKSAALPKKGELSINQLAWLDTAHRGNDLTDFDLWSEMIVRNIYAGRLAIG
jgi:predicted NUDIX family phosphoesterase